MLQSKLFTKTRREDPKDEVAKNAKLLIRAGFVHKEMAGVYSYLPLGLRVLNKINNIIRQEMDRIGGQEISMTALQNPEIWKKTDRWSDDKVDNWFKTELKTGGEVGLGFTHEEALTEIMKDFVGSYRDLPILAYQIQTKFRNETRAKSGVMRGREFLMKDLYSFHVDEKDLDNFHQVAREAYENIFSAIGLGDRTFMTFASGGVFSKYSYEFQTLCEAGEDIVYLAREKKLAINKEVLTDEVLVDLNLKREELEEVKTAEVGNIFKLGTKFSEPLGLTFLDEKGESRPVVMGSYGIGPARLLGTVVEVLSDDKGLVWPETIAPLDVHLLSLVKTGTDNDVIAREIYQRLMEKRVDVLYDDREISAGEKFADADLIGIPYRVIVSDKSLAENKLELKNRITGEVKMITEEELLEIIEFKNV